MSERISTVVLLEVEPGKRAEVEGHIARFCDEVAAKDPGTEAYIVVRATGEGNDEHAGDVRRVPRRGRRRCPWRDGSRADRDAAPPAASGHRRVGSGRQPQVADGRPPVTRGATCCRGRRARRSRRRRCRPTRRAPRGCAHRGAAPALHAARRPHRALDRARVLDASEVAVIDLDDEAARPQLRVAGQVGGVLHRRGGDPGPLQQVGRLVGRPLGRPRRQRRRAAARSSAVGSAAVACSSRRAHSRSQSATSTASTASQRSAPAQRDDGARAPSRARALSRRSYVPPVARCSTRIGIITLAPASTWARSRWTPVPVASVLAQRRQDAERAVVAGDVVEVVAVGVAPRRAQPDVVADVGRVRGVADRGPVRP